MSDSKAGDSRGKKPVSKIPICVIPGCDRKRFKLSIKCDQHQNICPRCMEREITTTLGYCDTCRDQIAAKITYIPFEPYDPLAKPEKPETPETPETPKTP